MKKIPVVLTIAAFAFVLGAEESATAQTDRPVADPQSQQTSLEGKGCTVPKAWGQLKGVADRAIAFEDSGGTIRVLDTGPCMRGETRLIVIINRP